MLLIIVNNDNRVIKDLAVKHQCSEVETVKDIIKRTPFMHTPNNNSDALSSGVT